MELLSSLPGQYVVQSALYSAIIAAVVEAMLFLWRIRSPQLQTRFRLLALILPVVVPALFFVLYPLRAAPAFREQTALFDFNRWLALGAGGVFVWHIFLASLALTAVYFVVREALPARRHLLEHRRLAPLEPGKHPNLDSALAAVAKTRQLPSPRVFISPEEAPVVYTRGRGALVVSAATVDLLNGDELEAVIAHEMAHLDQRVYFTGQLAAVLRLIAFYNPVALLVFHRIINDTEKDCDSVAVRVTGKGTALASGVTKVFRRTSATPAGDPDGLSERVSALEHRAHASLVRERLEILSRGGDDGEISYPSFRLLFLAGMLVALLFFVV